jgi:uncharacterized membrane protein
MNKRKLLLAAVIAGIFAIIVDLVVMWLLNRELIAADYFTSTTVGVLTAMAIFLLFRNRSGNRCG